jgi:PAS domain S-box-containing protein
MSALKQLMVPVAARIGGPRVLALPLIRAMALVAGYAWIWLARDSTRRWDAVDGTMLAFLIYSAAIFAALWLRPGRMLRLSLLVVALDITFALAFIHLTGGAQSTLFLALLVIAGLQSYYYRMRRGLLIAVLSGAAYLVLVWPTITTVERANMAIRIAVLLGTSIGVGILAELEDSERSKVLAMSGEAREREQFIRSVVEGLAEGLVVLDRDGRVVTWNRAIETRYGMPATDAQGRHLFDLNPAWSTEALAEPLPRLLRGEIERFTLEAIEHQTLRRGTVVLNVKASLVRHRGQPAGAVLLIEDITERQALEDSARQSEKLAALGTLSAGLAHELNNPIGIISARIELMLLESEGQELPSGVREDLGVIHRHAQRVARIVHSLLSFARRSAGLHTAVDLNQVVEETLLLVEKQVAREGIHLKRSLAPALPVILGDATALQQVMMNLLLNARDATPQGGEIRVVTEASAEPPGGARVVVSDTGSGIPAEALPRIFDPFYTTKPHGTGLGLSISYGIVRDHQGTCDVQSTPGVGTTFVLTFPATTKEPPA